MSMVKSVTIFIGEDFNEKGYFSIIVRDKAMETASNKIGLVINEAGIAKSRLNKMTLEQLEKLV